MSTKKQNSQRPKPKWWVYSLSVAVGVVVLLTFAYLLPHPYGAILVVVGALAFAAMLYFNPTYRYWRLTNSIVAAWICARSVPNTTLVAATESFPLFAAFGNDVPWTFDLAVGLVVIVLLVLDHEIRDGVKRTLNFQPRILSPHTLGTNSPASQNIVVGDLTGRNATVNMNYRSEGDFNVRIDQAASFLKQRMPDVTIVKLNDLRRESWDQLSNRERFRVEANLGHAYNCKDELKQAARHFLDARQYQPNDTDAAGLEAIAHFLLGDRKRAEDLADQVLAEAPRNENALVAKIRSADQSVATSELEDLVPTELRDNPQVLFALCCSASLRRDLEAAVDYSRRFHAILPDDEQAKMTLGCALANLAMDGHVGRREMSHEDCDSLAQEACLLLTEVLGFDGLTQITQAQAYYHRGLVQEVLGHEDRAEADLRTAVSQRPDDDALNYQLCVFLVRHEKFDEAIAHFDETHCTNSSINPVILLARLLFGRGNPEDFDRAEGLLLGILAEGSEVDDVLTFEALELLARELTKAGYDARAIELIAEFSERLDSSGRLTIEAVVALASDRFKEAHTAATEAHEQIKDDTLTVCLYYLGKALVDVGEDQRATEVLKLVTTRSGSPQASKLLLETAWAARDYGFVLKHAERLRELGRATLQSRDLEVASLEVLNEFHAALQLIEAYLESPDDDMFARYFRLKRSWIGKCLENEELVTYDSEQLPRLEDCEPSGQVGLATVCSVAQLLADGPDPDTGRRLAYEIVRRNFDALIAHQCLITVCGFGVDHPTEGNAVVDEQCAVSISDGRTSRIRWVVIERESPSGLRNEIGVSSHLGRELLGKCVGDRVRLNDDPLQDQFGVIEEIIDKISYRMMDSTRNWSRRFDNTGFIRQFDFSKPNGELDLDAFLDVQRKLHEPLEQAISIYRNRLPSIAFFASITHRSVLESLAYLAENSETHIQCCSGSVDEQEGKKELIESCGPIVLDPTCLATLYITKAHQRIKGLSDEVFVSAGTLDSIRALLGDRFSRFRSKHFIGYQSGQPRYEERTDTDVENEISELSSFMTWVNQNVTVVGGRGILRIPVNYREKYRECFGTAMVESLGVAIDRGATLCSDDQSLTALTSEHFPIDRIWTSAFLEHLQSQSRIDRGDLWDLLIQLIVFDYRFIPVEQELIDRVGMESSWSIADRRFSAVVEWLHRSQVVDPSSAAAYMIARTWDETQLAHKRSAVLCSVVRAIGKRNDAVKCLRRLHTVLRSVLSTRPMALRECHQAIRREEARELAVSPLILPGDPDFSIPRHFFQ